MSDALLTADWIALWALRIGLALAGTMAVAVVIERLAQYLHERFLRRLARQYGPLIERALHDDAEALDALVRSPSRYRIEIARLMISPLVDDRSPARIAATRDIFRALSLVPAADRLLRSRRWWRRTLALRALGLVQFAERAPELVAALDDPNLDVRNAALDALADLRDPATLDAIVVRLHDSSLQRGRRAAALAAFGHDCEGFLLDLARVDAAHRLNYARALAICGTARSRSVLCDWTADTREDVRAAAFEALGRTGLDDRAAALAVAALDSRDVNERAMAAAALHGWRGAGGTPARLAAHLGDAWPVAVRAASTLRSMGADGHAALETHASRADQAGVLSRQALWKAGAWR
jgi:HEAT repeat protein